MVQALITIARALAAVGGLPREREHYARSRRNHPASVQGAETIDGMLFVGLRPARRDAA